MADYSNLIKALVFQSKNLLKSNVPKQFIATHFEPAMADLEMVLPKADRIYAGLDNGWQHTGAWKGIGKFAFKGDDAKTFVRAVEDVQFQPPAHMEQAVKDTREFNDQIWEMLNTAGVKTRTVQYSRKVKAMPDGTTSERLVKEVHQKPIGKIDEYTTSYKTLAEEPRLRYFPHITKEGYVTAWYKDTTQLIRNAAMKEQSKGGVFTKLLKPQRGTKEVPSMDDISLAHLNLATEEALQHNTISPQTREALDLLMSARTHPQTGEPLQWKSYAEAVISLQNRAESQIANPASTLKKSREFFGPSHWYVEDPVVAMKIYLRSVSRRMAETEVWGPNWEKWMEHQNNLYQVSSNAGDIFTRLTGYMTGAAEHELAPDWYRKASRKFMTIEAGTKIGLGWAVIPNMLQWFNAVAKTGLYRGAASVLKSMTPEGREFSRLSGINNFKNNTMKVLAGDTGEFGEHSGIVEMIFGKHPGMILFEKVNQINNTVSVVAGRDAIKYWHKVAQKPNWGIGKFNRHVWAKENLKVLGIDASKPLTKNDLLEGAYRFANSNQLQKNVFKDPLLANDPRFRMFFLFKRFGFRQAAMVKDDFIKTELFKGNVLPILRLGTLGLAGGYFVNWSKNAIKREIFKAPDKMTDEDKGMVDQLVNTWAAFGSLGMFSDLAKLRGKNWHEKAVNTMSNAFYVANPVIGSELYGTMGSQYDKGWPGIAYQFAKKALAENGGIREAYESQAPNALYKVSPLAGLLGRRMRLAKEHENEVEKAYKEMMGIGKKKSSKPIRRKQRSTSRRINR